MTEKLTIFKNKDEVFKCQLNIEGSNEDDAVVRLCLEFDNNKNLFFYGNLQEDGECIINIPKLKEFDSKQGKLFIEAIADSTYFKLYESEFELKNSVEIKIEKPHIVKEHQALNVKLTKPVVEIKQPIIEAKEEVLENDQPKPLENPYISNFEQWRQNRKR